MPAPLGTGSSEPWTDAANWSKADREALWTQLLESLDDMARGIAPACPREVQEAILSVNARLKISGPAGDQTSAKSALGKLLKAFSRTGEVIQWECDTNPAVSSIEPLRWVKLSEDAFERLIFNVVSSARGYENPEWLTHTNATDKGRDISVQRVTSDALSGTRRMRVIIQCKHKKCVGVGEVSRLKEQMMLWEPPRVDELIIATTGRFSTDAVRWIEKHNQSNQSLHIIMWPENHLELLLAQRPHLIAEFKLMRGASRPEDRRSRS